MQNGNGRAPRKARGKAGRLEDDLTAATVSNVEDMLTRTALATMLGVTFGGIRDVYTALGHNRTPTDQDFYNRFKRQGIARRIVKAPPEACWGKPPRITESKELETPFEVAWTELESAVPIWELMMRADIRSRIGYYGILFLGFDDGKKFSEPVERANRLLYGMPFSSLSARIKTWETDERNPRYGLPLTYSVTFRSLALGATIPNQKGTQQTVDWSRVIHFADDLEEDNIFSAPALEPCLNDLENLEKVIGGGAEGFWRNAFPGTVFNLQADAHLPESKLASLREQIENYVHGMERVLRTQGVDTTQLTTQFADPIGMISGILDMLAATTNIPKRILIGSERGELASSQDEDNWLGFVGNRISTYCGKKTRELIDRLGSVGVLEVPKYTLDWPPLIAKTEEKQAVIAQQRASAIATYSSSPGSHEVVAPDMFLRWGLGMTDEEIEENAEMVKEVMADEERLEQRLQELLGLQQPQLGPGQEAPEEEADEDEEAPAVAEEA
jgi:hypothetical protein